VELNLDIKDKPISGQHLFYSVYDLQSKKYLKKNEIIGSDNKLSFPILVDYFLTGNQCRNDYSLNQNHKFMIQITGVRFSQYNLSFPIELSIDNKMCTGDNTSAISDVCIPKLKYEPFIVLTSHVTMKRHPALTGATVNNIKVDYGSFNRCKYIDEFSIPRPVTLTYEFKIPFAYSLGSSYIRTKLNPDVYDVVQNDFKF
jgi:hypothetical protein